MGETEAMMKARHAVVDAARRAMNFAADFTCQANDCDRPQSERPGTVHYGDQKYDPRWYAVREAQTHFNESIAGRLSDALAVYAAVVLIEREAADA